MLQVVAACSEEDMKIVGDEVGGSDDDVVAVVVDAVAAVVAVDSGVIRIADTERAAVEDLRRMERCR